MAIVCNMQGKFKEIRQCKSPEYFQAVFNFPQEVYGKVFKLDEMPNPQSTNILCSAKTHSHLFDLEPGKMYNLLASLSVNKANESNGKVYPASLNISILDVK